LKAFMTDLDRNAIIRSTVPSAEYLRRQNARHDEARRHERQESLAGHGRVAAFLAILVVVYAMVRTGHLLVPWLLCVLVAFMAAVAWHRRVVRALERARRASRYYARALARLDDHWPGIGPSGEQYGSREHPYARDLDLFGRGSLYQLLCSARTRMGHDALADWLRKPADRTTILARQTAIAELRETLDLREELAVLDAPATLEASPETLRAWIGKAPLLADRVRPLLAIVLALASVITLVGWIFFGTGSSWFLLVAILQAVLLRNMRQPMRELTSSLDSVLSELDLFLKVLRLVEVQQFVSPALHEIHVRLHSGGRPASRWIAQLSRLVDTWETVRRNQFVAPLAFVLMLPVHLAYAIGRWRRSNGHLAIGWLEAVGEFEAMCCLAGFAYEHPEYPFPTIAEKGPCLDARGLGHPLIPAKRRVTNDIHLGAEPRLLLVSGSNMSGKSTLLRTVGINAVLALAGAPVCATRMQVSRLAVASAMRTVDSLQEGVSAFYAEIQRLRMICDMAAGPPPVLFLLDEILHGTNSHDRRIGAEAVIERLLKHGAVGLVTTHDLALSAIAERKALRAANAHFEDQLADGQMSFDYRLRPGVVPKGNALVLMRLLGFDV
jgi:hypothetical protein